MHVQEIGWEAPDYQALVNRAYHVTQRGKPPEAIFFVDGIHVHPTLAPHTSKKVEASMKTIHDLNCLFLGLCLSALAGAQTGTTLLVKTDMSCNWKLDGQPMGLLKADAPIVVAVSPADISLRPLPPME